MSGLTRGVALVAAVALLAAVPLSARGPVADAASDPMAFWSTPRHGANGGLSHLRPEWFEAAATAGIEWVRLHPDTHTAAERDFLIGDADSFREVNEEDLRVVRRALDMAHEND